MDIPTPAQVIADFAALGPAGRARLAARTVTEDGGLIEGTLRPGLPSAGLDPAERSPLGWWDAKAAAYAALGPTGQRAWWRDCGDLERVVGLVDCLSFELVSASDHDALDLAETALLAALANGRVSPSVLARLLEPWTSE
jgi:hypothetical protein